MTFRKLALLGSVLAGAAYLQNKDRRDRFMGGARNLFDNVRNRLDQVRQQQGGSIDQGYSTSSMTSDPGMSRPSTFGSPAGSNGIY